MGAIICGLVLATLSLVVGPPGPSGVAPNSVDVAVPAGSEFNRDRPEAPPVIPGNEQTGETESAPLVPSAEGEATPLADTTPASVPVSGSESPEEMAAPSTGGSDLTFSLGDEDKDEEMAGESPAISGSNVTTEGVPETPSQSDIQIQLPTDDENGPQTSGELTNDGGNTDGAIVLDLGTDSEGEQTPEEPLVLTLDADQDETENDGPVLNLTLGDDAENTGEKEADTTDANAGGSLFTTDNAQSQTDVETPVIRLPTIGTNTDTTSEEDNGPVAVEEEADPQIKLGALARNSRPFVAEGDKPLMALVLIDVGEEGLGQEGLSTFSFPVTIALDPTKGNGLSAATKYRAAGLEVLIQSPPLPAGSSPEEVGQRLSSLVSFVPQAIGVVDSARDGFGSNRRLIGEAIRVLNEDGHGLLTYDRGLNTAQQMAEKEGLPAGVIFRTIDAEQEDADTIKRYLDRAAFRAGQDGHVIMIGHSYSETVTAIFTWVQENRAAGVTLAPVSAILRQ